MIGTAPSAASPLTRVFMLVPDASVAIAGEAQRTAMGMFRFGVRCAATVIGVATSPPLVRRPLEQFEAHVGDLAARGAGQRRRTVMQAGVLLQRSEPLVTRALERAVAILPVDALLARVDVDGIVGRVDIDALIARVDVDGIVGRVDIERLVSEVLAGIELGDLIHDSTTSIVTDARDGVRTGAVTADTRIARLVDRVLRRQHGRELFIRDYGLGATT